MCGCNVVGTWSTIEVAPQDRPFPIASVTLADDGTYCVSQTTGSQTRTTAGTYRWDGVKLALNPGEGAPQHYAGGWRLDGRLVLSHGSGRDRVRAVLERQSDGAAPTSR